MPHKPTPAVRHHRNGIVQPIGAQTLGPQEPEERPQRRRDELKRLGLEAARRPSDEPDDMPGSRSFATST